MRPSTLLLLLVGCASSGPAEYQQGALRPPQPPAARPGVGAPVLGQPGSAASSAPHSPHKRVLPPTKEPGLWAADEPRASFQTPTAPILLGVLMPTSPDGKDKALAIRCAEMMGWAAGRLGVNREALTWSERDRRCVAARLFTACTEEAAHAIDIEMRKSKTPDPDYLISLRLMGLARSFGDRECPREEDPYGVKVADTIDMFVQIRRELTGGEP